MKIGPYELDSIVQGDCLELMKALPDKSIDLILTDPPYGIGAAKGIGRINQNFQGCWDIKPPKKVFDEILRISEKVIIFGGNYLTDVLPQNNKWFVWDKINTMRNYGTNFSDVELIWTNLEGNTSHKFIHIHRGGQVSDGKKYHPTQKPLYLIIDILKFIGGNGIVLDPFLGSGTTALAAKQLGRHYIGFELEPSYVAIAEKRLKQEVLSQWTLTN